MKKYPFLFWAVPQSSVEDIRLQPGEMLLLGILYTRVNADFVAWPTQEYLADKLHCDVRTIQRYISHLEELGWLTIDRTPNQRVNFYKMNLLELGRQIVHPTPVSGEHDIAMSSEHDTAMSHYNIDNKIENKIDPHASRENGELSYETPDDSISTKELRRKEAIEQGYKGHLSNPLIKWAENRMGQKFGNSMKQKAALSKMLQSGRTPEQIKECWISLENDEFWTDKGFDFMTVLNQISKARRRGPRVLKIS